MGVQITELIEGKNVKLDDLRSKVFAVDSYNLLYQFLSSIRQPDGALLMDSHGNVTSHLSGLFFRITNLMSYNMRFVFCFDGKVPDLKKAEQLRRHNLKQEAQKKFEQAAADEDVEAMKKFASRTSRLTPEMIAQAKELMLSLGQCVVDAPSEGEAQASYIVKKGDADFVLSQDADCLLFGASKMVKNLTITGRRKRPGVFASTEISPQLIVLRDVLSQLELTQDQLIALGMLVGTDYNINGIKGIGPKKALVLVKKHGESFDSLFSEAKWDESFSTPWRTVFDTIKQMKVDYDYKLEWGQLDKEKLLRILVDKHELSRERVESQLARLETAEKKQKGLGEFF